MHCALRVSRRSSAKSSDLAGFGLGWEVICFWLWDVWWQFLVKLKYLCWMTWKLWYGGRKIEKFLVSKNIFEFARCFLLDIYYGSFIEWFQLFTEALSSQSDVDVQKMKYFSQFNNNILELFSQGNHSKFFCNEWILFTELL